MSTVSSKIYLSSFSGPVFDQGQEGSCVANAVCQAVRLQSREYHQDTGELARNQIYYDFRAAYRDVHKDLGASVGGMLTTAQNAGIAIQLLADPYDGTVKSHNEFAIEDTTSAVYQAPNPSARASASSEKLMGYTDYSPWLIWKNGVYGSWMEYDPATGGTSAKAVQDNINPIIDQQLMHGKAVIVAGTVPQWMNAVYFSPLSSQNAMHYDDSPLDEHAFLIVGRDDNLSGGSYIVENSWGSGHGDKGYLTIPYSFLSDGIKLTEIAVVEGFNKVDTKWTAERANVAELYVALLDRAVEHSGIEFWGQLQLNGMSERTVAGEILKSAEATQKLAGLSNADFVQKIYFNATGTFSSSLGNWEAQLNQGASRNDVAVSILDSLLNSTGQGHDTFTNRVTVAETFGLTYQIDNASALADRVIETVTANADSVQIALTGIQHDLGWLAASTSTFAFSG